MTGLLDFLGRLFLACLVGGGGLFLAAYVAGLVARNARDG